MVFIDGIKDFVIATFSFHKFIDIKYFPIDIWGIHKVNIKLQRYGVYMIEFRQEKGRKKY